MSPVERRNFRLHVMNGALMNSADAVAAPDLVLTAFAAHLTGNPLILGVIAPMPAALWSLPQLWMVKRLQAMARVLPVYRLALALRFLCWVALIGVALMTRDSTALLVTLFAFIFLWGLASGIAGLPYLEVVGKTVTPRRRGLLFSLRQTFGSLLGIAGAQSVVFFTGPGARFDFPTSYALLFVVAAVLQLGGGLAFSLIQEPPNDFSAKRPAPSPAALRAMWRDADFRRYLLGQTLMVLGGMAGGLVIVYAHQRLGVRLELAGLYLLVGAILKPAISVAAGRVSLRFGNRAPVVAGQVAQALAWALLLMAKPAGISGRAAEYYMFLVYGLVALQQSLLASNLLALGLNVAPDAERALYMGALNTWVGLLLLVSMSSGLIAETIGYEALFLLTALLAAVSARQFATLRERLDDGQAA